MMSYCTDSIKEYCMHRGVRPDVFAFYGKNSPFSNFHACVFDDQFGHRFYSNEQYVMYRKAVLFGDDVIAAQLLHPNVAPLTCKKLGRKIKGFNGMLWEEHKAQIMKAGLYFKFSQNQTLLTALFNTRDSVLAEASPYDRIWGTGVDIDQSRVIDQWRGQNLLGFCLMEVRDVLTEQLSEQQ